MSKIRNRSLLPSLALLIVIGIPAVLWMSGCGSGSSATSAGALNTKNAARGRATLTFIWPKRSATARLIPIDANSITISVTAADGTSVGTQILARPTSGATSATAEFDNLVVGSYTVTATAFPNADGTGNAQATAQTSVTIVANQLVPITLTMASTIASLTISPQPTSLTVGQSVSLIATPMDAQGNVVLIGPSTLQWSTSASGVASVDATGKVVGVSQGQATITATERESGKTASLVLTVSGVLSISLPKYTNYQINAAHNGSTTWGVPLTFPPSPTWTATLNGAVSFPLIAEGKVFVMTANQWPAQGANLYALDERSGTVLWGPVAVVQPQVSTGFNGLAYENGKIFAVSGSAFLETFDAGTGASLWSATLPGEYFTFAPPTAANGIVYVTAAESAGYIYALDEATGNLLWKQEVVNGDAGSPTVSVDGNGVSTGIFASYPCQTYDFNPTTGAQLWHDDTGCDGGGGQTPVFANGLLYVSDWVTGNTIYNPLTGSSVGTFVANQMPAISATKGFFLSSGTLRGTNLSTNSVLWSFAGDGTLQSAPLAVDNTVFIAGSSGKIYALDGTTGSQIWTGSTAGSQPAMGVGEGYLVVSSGSTITAWHIAGQ